MQRISASRVPWRARNLNELVMRNHPLLSALAALMVCTSVMAQNKASQSGGHAPHGGG